jgi:hypothetical protein
MDYCISSKVQTTSTSILLELSNTTLLPYFNYLCLIVWVQKRKLQDGLSQELLDLPKDFPPLDIDNGVLMSEEQIELVVKMEEQLPWDAQADFSHNGTTATFQLLQPNPEFAPGPVGV